MFWNSSVIGWSIRSSTILSFYDPRLLVFAHLFLFEKQLRESPSQIWSERMTVHLSTLLYPLGGCVPSRGEGILSSFMGSSFAKWSGTGSFDPSSSRKERCRIHMEPRRKHACFYPSSESGKISVAVAEICGFSGSVVFGPHHDLLGLCCRLRIVCVNTFMFWIFSVLQVQK
ncbi:hypothetical protein BJ508DRAFT_78555 [Ascobolus immersus RN42]|uniref:Uncharacterized protein n=1 Tax=Ascobolus immersus RN42 TaxID=1160509 RepID=A0A3N4IAH8_ASCIM|nr:hypothetical protein BJ508DRAFT_78555 [Ascobolus immersus RN42]